MGELAGGGPNGNNVEFRTLPVVRYDNIDGQDVNIIDQAAIKSEVAAAIGAAPETTTPATTASTPSPSTVVDVVNAGSMSGLASEVSRALKKRGYTAGQVRDRESGDPAATTIQYGTGAETDAHNVATLLGLEGPKQPDPSLRPGHIRVTLDTSFSMPAVDDTSTTDETTTTTTSKANRYGYGATTTYPTPDQGKPIDGGGVPCVN
jgi:LytR cell envelope-related transcriptional attenuator